MPPDDLLDGQVDPAPVAAPPTPQGQPSDYEARFKGLQREYNKLKLDYDASFRLNTELQSKNSELNSAVSDSTKSSQSELSRLTAEVNALNNAKTTLETQLADAQKAATAEQKKNALRTQIVTDFPEQASALTAAIDKGFLSPGDREGETLKSFLTEYLDFTGTKVTQQVNQTIRGASPPSLAAGDQLTIDENKLGDWIMTHDERDPQWETNYEAWLRPSKK